MLVTSPNSAANSGRGSTWVSAIIVALHWKRRKVCAAGSAVTSCEELEKCGCAWLKSRGNLAKKRRLLVCHFVDLLFHHVPATVNQSFLDAWDFRRSVFYVGSQFKSDWTEGTCRDEFYFDCAWFFFFHVCDHLHFSKTHACLWVKDFTYFFADFIFQFCQAFSLSHFLLRE